MIKIKLDYYNPQKILSTLDLDKEEPAIYMISTNRSAGKTTAFLKLSLEHFQETKRKTILLYRYKYELNACADIFKDVLKLYPDYGIEMTSQSNAMGMFYELFLDGESYGYAIAMSNPDTMKKYSPIFSDVDFVIFDEFQTESGKYLPKETEKFQSIMLTIARGGGSQSRKIKVFMLSNLVSIMNPYYIQFGIHKRIKTDTKIMRGKGWVAEFGFNDSASKQIKQNGIAKAFSDSDYIKYSTEKEYLKQTDSFIEQPKGKSKYLFTIVHDGIKIGVRDCFENGVMYCSKKYDKSCTNVVTFKASDHNQNTMMLSHYSYLWKNIKDAFMCGCLRFDDLQTKNAIFEILAVDMYK